MRLPPLVLPLVWAAAAHAGTLEDMDLRRNVEAAVRGSAPTANLHLKIEVAGGVVVPEGVVRDLLQIDAVVDLAGSIKGIKGVDRSRLRLEYAGESDDKIASRVLRTLLQVQHLATSAVRVDVRQGVVTLDGTIGRAAYREEVRRLCGSVQGVLDVVDRLVSPDSPDEAIRKALDRVFAARANPRFPGRVEPQVDHGAVVLSGRVPRLRDRDRALRTAWSIDGVRMVVDDLAIQPTAHVEVIRP